MSCYRQQAQIDVAPAVIWDLVGNVERHPEWWPRVIDVQCDGLEQGFQLRMGHARGLETGGFVDLRADRPLILIDRAK